MKTINISNIIVKEFSIAKDNKGEFSISAIYTMLDSTGKEIFTKRAELKDLSLTNPQKNSIEKVETLILDTIKNIEQI